MYDPPGPSNPMPTTTPSRAAAGPSFPPMPPPERGGRGLAWMIVGGLLALPALSLVLGGIGVLYALGMLETDGYYLAPSQRYESPEHAIVSGGLDLREVDSVPLVGEDLRLRLEADGSTEPVFLGIARTDQVERALDGVSHSAVSRIQDGTQGEDVEYVHAPGGPPAAPPHELVDWEAQASGAGTVQLDWDPRPGDWTAVAMNADGSPGLTMDLRIGARVPLLRDIGWWLVAAGVVLAGIAVALVVKGVRQRRRAREGSITGFAPGGTSVAMSSQAQDQPSRGWE